MSLVEMVGDVVDESIELPPSINEFHIEPRCRVCRDDEVRKKVNDLLATGTSFAMVLRALGEDKTALGKADRVEISSRPVDQRVSGDLRSRGFRLGV